MFKKQFYKYKIRSIFYILLIIMLLLWLLSALSVSIFISCGINNNIGLRIFSIVSLSGIVISLILIFVFDKVGIYYQNYMINFQGVDLQNDCSYYSCQIKKITTLNDTITLLVKYNRSTIKTDNNNVILTINKELFEFCEIEKIANNKMIFSPEIEFKTLDNEIKEIAIEAGIFSCIINDNGIFHKRNFPKAKNEKGSKDKEQNSKNKVFIED